MSEPHRRRLHRQRGGRRRARAGEPHRAAGEGPSRWSWCCRPRRTTVGVPRPRLRPLPQRAVARVAHRGIRVARGADVASKLHVRYAGVVRRGAHRRGARVRRERSSSGPASGGLLGRTRIGSVANELLHSSDVPVVLAPAARATSPREPGRHPHHGCDRHAPGRRRAARVGDARSPRHARRCGWSRSCRSTCPPASTSTSSSARRAPRTPSRCCRAAPRPARRHRRDGRVATGATIEDAVQALDWHEGELVLVGSSRLAAAAPAVPRFDGGEDAARAAGAHDRGTAHRPRKDIAMTQGSPSPTPRSPRRPQPSTARARDLHEGPLGRDRSASSARSSSASPASPRPTRSPRPWARPSRRSACRCRRSSSSASSRCCSSRSATASSTGACPTRAPRSPGRRARSARGSAGWPAGASSPRRSSCCRTSPASPVDFLFLLISQIAGNPEIADLAANPFINVVVCLLFMLGATWISYRDMQTTQKLQYWLVGFQVAGARWSSRSPRSSRSPTATRSTHADRALVVQPVRGRVLLGVRGGPLAVDLHLLGLGRHPHHERGDEGPEKTPGRAATLTVVIIVVLYLLIAVALIAFAGVGDGEFGLGNPDIQDNVFFHLAGPILGPLAVLVSLAVLTSSASSLQSTFVSPARTLLAMGHYGACPRSSRRSARGSSRPDTRRSCRRSWHPCSTRSCAS